MEGIPSATDGHHIQLISSQLCHDPSGKGKDFVLIFVLLLLTMVKW